MNITLTDYSFIKKTNPMLPLNINLPISFTNTKILLYFRNSHVVGVRTRPAKNSVHYQ